MLKTSWLCSRCLLRVSRNSPKYLVRFQSNVAPQLGDISPALLSRAKSLASQHTTLASQLATEYDARAAKKLGQLTSVTNALKDYEKSADSLAELQTLLADTKTDPDLRELAKEDIEPTKVALSTASAILKTSLVPQHPFAHMPCLLEIRPGAGGSEAALFAGDLLRMYTSYCSRAGLHCNVLKYEDADGQADPRGSDAPLQEAVLEIESEGAYGILRSEAGVHRVQRVPATESKGRTHTSAASVLVLPSFPEEGHLPGEEDTEDPESEYYINPSDVKTDTMRARGAGGQHVNTTNSAIRLTHMPSGTVVSCQDGRSQPKNKAKAWRILRSRLAQERREAKEAEMVALRRSVVGVARIGRGDKVRTYNWGQQRVTDHRSGLSVHDLDDVMEGGLELERVMESVRGWLGEQEVLDVVAEEEAKDKA